MNRRTRLGLILTGLLAVVSAANWVAITDHIGNLRNGAAQASGDAAPELLAQAQDFRAAQTAFAILTVALVVTFAALIAWTVTRSRRDRRVT